VRAWAVAAALIALLPAAAAAQKPESMRSSASPSTARLGERVIYRGRALFPRGADPAQVRWLPPEDDERFAWGVPSTRYVPGGAARPAEGKAGREPATDRMDTAFVEIPLQAFALGVIQVPGIRFEVQQGSRAVAYRLPVLELPVTPVLTAADSNASLKPLRGPLEAPWWERVPWLLVALGLLVIVAAIWLWRRLRRRKPAPTPVRPTPVVTLDPVTEALRELVALRRLGLPHQGLFADHAARLTRIVRRFLERSTGLPRPGDTTPELVLRLSPVAESVAGRVAPLLKSWDLVKFARAESSVGAAESSEQKVETIVRETKADQAAAAAAAFGETVAGDASADAAARAGKPEGGP
jgi:hypothetical protein